jgi:UDP-2,3-diacylglucosamine pyrophosphatase LpxH
MRTLVISDLHLGRRLDRDVLRRPAALAALLRALEGVQRLVLLGDVVELMEGAPDRAVQSAMPVLRALGERIGPRGEIILVPGNHDRALVMPWMERCGVPVALDAAVPPDATALLGQVVSSLAPAQVRVHYPGVWLSDRVWATHGHYLDRHLLPEHAFGIARGLLGRVPRDGATPNDYERSGGPSVTRIESLLARHLPRPLAALADDLVELLRAGTMPAVRARLLSPRTARLTSSLLGMQMLRASIPALARATQRLGVDADWVIFGHVHRRGPLAGDNLGVWSGPGGRPRIANTGAWVYDPVLLHRARLPHPYWPGGAIVIEDGGVPRAVGLLDHLDAGALHGR